MYISGITNVIQWTVNCCVDNIWGTGCNCQQERRDWEWQERQVKVWNKRGQ